MTPQEILEAARKEAKTGRDLFAVIGKYLGIPYLVERETNPVIEVRTDVPEGQEARVWSHANNPDSYNNIEEALAKLGRPQALWYHIPSMNLVILDEKEKVGIRSTAFRMALLGFMEGPLLALIEGLQAKMLLAS